MEFFRGQLYDNFSLSLTKNKIKFIYLLFEVRGPHLTDDSHIPPDSRGLLPLSTLSYFPPSNRSEDDLTPLVEHPYVKLTRKRVVCNDDALFKRLFRFPITISPEEMANEVMAWLASLPVVTEQKISYAVEPHLLEEFTSWCDLRRKEFEAEQHVKALLPYITSEDFYSQLAKWEEFGSRLVDEVGRIRSALEIIGSSGQYDLITIKSIMRTEYERSGKTEFSRDEILDFWATKERKQGDSRSEQYLRDHHLRPRLTNVIESLQRSPDPQISITKDLQKRGRPKDILIWNVRGD